MNKKQIIFNYIITNSINRKQYIGSHSTDYVDDGYLGSGKAIKEAIKKYGKENFTKEIICFCYDVSTSFYNESIYIKEYNTLSPNGYNLSPSGGLGIKGCHSKETKNKISNTRKKGYKNGNIKKLIGEKNPMFGINPWNKNLINCYSKKALEKMSIASKGKIISKEQRKNISKTLKNLYQNKKNHPMYGKKHNEETKNKISKSLMGKMKGENNSKCDQTIYTFIHPIHGMKKCTKYELRTNYNLYLSHLCNMIDKKRKSHKGWRLQY